MTRDGANNLILAYNHLNLIQKVSQNATTLANYSYLWNGTKLSATDASGNGLCYLGSLVYNKQGGAYSLESAGFNGGRIIATNNNYKPQYFLTDHLGSVRAVVNDEGTAVEQNDYYPFGLRYNQSGEAANNRYLFNGKELQSFVNVPYLDYGARMYNPKLGRCHNIDPMASLYGNFSPYNYCLNNPLKYIDWQGRAAVPVFFIGGMAFTAAEFSLLYFSVISAGFILQKSPIDGSIEFTPSAASIFKDNPGWDEQQRRDRRNKEQLDLSQANVQNSINNNFPDPDDYDPNKGPEFRSGDKKTKFALYVLFCIGSAQKIDKITLKYLMDILFGEDEESPNPKKTDSFKPNKETDEQNKKTDKDKEEDKQSEQSSGSHSPYYMNYQEYLRQYFPNSTQNSH